MSAVPVIVIFDVGKTNKKVLVFDGGYNVLHEHGEHLPETVDDDGYPCEDIHLLTKWLKGQWEALLRNERWDVRAVNFSGYGASFVNLDASGAPVGPLYNYLKPLQANLREKFHSDYPQTWSATASPDLDNLNSGIQLYMIRHSKPALFARIATSLHLPQYLAYSLTGRPFADLTSLGCHTAMWDFQRSTYAPWVEKEGLATLQAPIAPSNSTVEIKHKSKIIYSGIGLHDSSAALIPYLATIREPFCLLSTGTWCITLNPFNQEPLTAQELGQDCLCYLGYHGKAVKASRVFSGHFHDQQANILAVHFKKPESFFQSLGYEALSGYVGTAKARNIAMTFEPFDPTPFKNYESAYSYLIEELVARQIAATRRVLSKQVKDIFVDGGFSANPLFMALLVERLPGYRVKAASVAQASALGAALAIHSSWNSEPIPKDLIKVKSYPG